jgi:hypothetical protein
MKKAFILIIILFFIVIVVSAKIQTNKNTKSVVFSDPPLSGQLIEQNIYISQLSKTELKIYQILIDRIKNLEDGVVEFPQAITGLEFLRIKNCVEDFSNDTSIAFVYRPITQDGFTPVSITPDEIDCKNKAVYTKCILFLYSSSHKPEDVRLSSDNHITNLSLFSTSAVDKKIADDTLELEKKGRSILDGVIANVPKGSGQRDALYYFIQWINNNLEYDKDSNKVLQDEGYKIFGDPNNLFSHYIFPSSLSCVVKRKALCLGYAKTLSYLCNRVGIHACVIIGNVKLYDSYIGHAITEVTISGQNAYFDLSYVWDYSAGPSKAMNLKTVETILKPVDYFEYCNLN